MSSAPVCPVDVDREAELRAALLSSAAAGHSPSGGPRLTRPEIELLRGAEGDAREAVLLARTVEWRLSSAVGEGAAEAAAEARQRAMQVDAELSAIEAALFERNETGSRELYVAHAALRRRLGMTFDLTEATAADGGAEADRVVGEERPGPRPRRKRPAKRARPAGRGKRAEARRIAVLGAALVAAAIVAWVIYPTPLRQPPVVPQASALSSKLDLRDLHMVGRAVFGVTGNWSSLPEAERQRMGEEACGRAQALGFAGLVLFDTANERVMSCMTQTEASNHGQ